MGDADALLRQLRKACRRFTSRQRYLASRPPSADVPGAVALAQAAEALCSATADVDVIPSSPELLSALCELSELLPPLMKAAIAQEPPGGEAFDDQVAAEHTGQLMWHNCAACQALTSCARLAAALQPPVPPAAAYRIAAACKDAVLRPGVLVLDLALRMKSGWAAERARRGRAAGQQAQQEEDSISSGVLRQVRRAASPQLSAFASVVQLLLGAGQEERLAQTAAAFAATAAAPAVLLPWLRKLADGLACYIDRPGSRLPETCHLDVHPFGSCLARLAASPAFAAHTAALAADTRLQDSIVDLLLSGCLQAPEGLGQNAGALVQISAHVLASSTFCPAVERRMRQAGAGAPVQRAADVAASCPAKRPDGMPLSEFAQLHTDAALLLANCCFGMQRGEASDSSPRSSSGGSSGGIGQQAAPPGGIAAAEWEAAGAALLGLLPHMAATAAALEESEEVAMLCQRYSVALEAVQVKCLPVWVAAMRQAAQDSSTAIPLVSALFAATEAGLRVQPLLARLHERLQAHENELLSTAPHQLSLLLFQQLRMLTHAASVIPTAQAGAASRSWQLHSCLCRLVHWLAASGAGLAGWAGTERGLQFWLVSQDLLLAFVSAHYDLNAAPAGESSEEQAARERRLKALCSAHWEALLVARQHGPLAGMHAPGPLAELIEEEGPLPPACISHLLTTSALYCAEACPRLLPAPELPAILFEAAATSQALAAAAAAARGPGRAAGGEGGGTAGSEILSALTRQPMLAAALFAAALFAAVGGKSGSGSARDPLGLFRLTPEGGLAGLPALSVLFVPTAFALSWLQQRLQDGGEPAGGGDENAPPAGQAATAAAAASSRAAAKAAAAREQQAALLDQLRQADGQYMPALRHAEAAVAALRALPATAHSGGRRTALAAAEEAVRQLQGPAVALSKLLLQFWQLPEMVDADRRLLAETAAARSCANLRCPNLALEGGPAVRQGQGCKRCSKCKAAFYCGEQCQHADWRLHKKGCAALAAERQAA